MPFQPSDLSGLKLWLKADAITGLNDGDSVTTWNDSSGLGNNATQSTASKKPTYKTNILNGRPVIRFDGSTDALLTPSISIGTFTAFAVFKATTSAPVYEQGPTTGTSPGFHLWTGITTMRVNKNFVSSAKNHPSGGTWATDGVWRMTSQAYNGTHASFLLWVNGSSVAMTDSTVGSPGTGNVSDVVYIGARAGTSGYLNGDIAEIIFYDSSLSTTDRQNVENYLSDKYFRASVQSAAFSIPTPSVSNNILQAGMAMGLLLALTYGSAGNVNADVLSGAFSVPSSVVTGSASLSAEANSATFSVPPPTVGGAANSSGDVQAVTFTVPSPTVIGGANVNAGAQTSTFTIQAPTVSGGEPPGASGDVQTGSFTVPSPTATGAAETSSGALSAAFSAPAPTIAAGGLVSAGVIGPTFSVPAPSTAGSAAHTATVQTASFTVPTPTAGAQATVAATVRTATFTVPSPTLAGGGAASPNVTASAFSIPSPTVGGAAGHTASVQASAFGVQAPSLAAGAAHSPVAVTAAFSMPIPFVSNGRTWTTPSKPVTAWADSSKPSTTWAGDTKPASVWSQESKPPLDT